MITATNAALTSIVSIEMPLEPEGLPVAALTT
jgi:hypothetical protein